MLRRVSSFSDLFRVTRRVEDSCTAILQFRVRELRSVEGTVQIIFLLSCSAEKRNNQQLTHTLATPSLSDTLFVRIGGAKGRGRPVRGVTLQSGV